MFASDSLTWTAPTDGRSEIASPRDRQTVATFGRGRTSGNRERRPDGTASWVIGVGADLRAIGVLRPVTAEVCFGSSRQSRSSRRRQWAAAHRPPRRTGSSEPRAGHRPPLQRERPQGRPRRSWLPSGGCPWWHGRLRVDVDIWSSLRCRLAPKPRARRSGIPDLGILASADRVVIGRMPNASARRTLKDRHRKGALPDVALCHLQTLAGVQVGRDRSYWPCNQTPIVRRYSRLRRALSRGVPIPGSTSCSTTIQPP